MNYKPVKYLQEKNYDFDEMKNLKLICSIQLFHSMFNSPNNVVVRDRNNVTDKVNSSNLRLRILLTLGTQQGLQSAPVEF